VQQRPSRLKPGETDLSGSVGKLPACAGSRVFAARASPLRRCEPRRGGTAARSPRSFSSRMAVENARKTARCAEDRVPTSATFPRHNGCDARGTRGSGLRTQESEPLRQRRYGRTRVLVRRKCGKIHALRMTLQRGNTAPHRDLRPEFFLCIRGGTRNMRRRNHVGANQ